MAGSDVFSQLFGVKNSGALSLFASNPYKRSYEESTSVPNEVNHGGKRRGTVVADRDEAPASSDAGKESQRKKLKSEKKGSSAPVDKAAHEKSPALPAKKVKEPQELKGKTKKKSLTNGEDTVPVKKVKEPKELKKQTKKIIPDGEAVDPLPTRSQQAPEAGVAALAGQDGGASAAEGKENMGKTKEKKRKKKGEEVEKGREAEAGGQDERKTRSPKTGGKKKASQAEAGVQEDEDLQQQQQLAPPKRQVPTGRGGAALEAGGAISERAPDLVCSDDESGDSDGDGYGGGKGGKKQKKQGGAAAADDAEKLARTVFVGNLPKEVTRKALAREFAQFGKLQSVRLRSVPLAESKLPRKAAIITGKLSDKRQSCNGYVVFESLEGADAALAHNTKEFQGRHLRVDKAAPKGTSQEGSPFREFNMMRSVFVGSLPIDVEEEELYEAFGGASAPEGLRGAVEAVRAVRDKNNNMGRGVAFVLFKTKEAAKVALAMKDPKLRNRRIRVSRLIVPPTAVAASGKAAPDGGRRPGGKPAPGASAGGGAMRRLGGAGEEGRHSWQGRAAAMEKTKGPQPFEGVRASKPGKGSGNVVRKSRGGFQSSPGGGGGGRGSKPGDGGGGRGGAAKKAAGPEKKVKGTKRPSVAARKAAAKARGPGGAR
eukprot:jgi/Mesen1/3588/ME000020S03115